MRVDRGLSPPRSTLDTGALGRRRSWSRSGRKSLEQSRKHAGKSLLVMHGRIDLSLWGQLIDNVGQVLGQELRDLRRVHSEFRGESLNLLASESLLNLIARDGRV